MKKNIFLNPAVLLVAIVSAVVAAYWVGVPFLDLMELKTVDLRFRSRGEVPTGNRVVLAVVDEKSINQEGKWIWPRSKMVQLVDRLSQAGAAVIGFDIGFLEPDDKLLSETVEDIRLRARSLTPRSPDFEQYLDEIRRRSDHDRMLADAIAGATPKVVLGYFFHMGGDGASHAAADDIQRDEESIKGSGYPLVRYGSEAAERFPLIDASAPEANIPEISQATAYSGFFNMFPDADGVVRRIPAVIRYQDLLYAPLSLKTLSAYLNVPLSARVDDHGVAFVELGDRRVPTDELGRVFIHYYGGVGTFPHISVTDILRGRVEAERLKDKIVLVGATAVGIYDLRVTPFGSVFPGLEVHANVVESILDQRNMVQPAWAAGFDILAIAAAGLLMGLVSLKAGAVFGAAAAVALFAGYIFTCQHLFVARGWILNLVYPLCCILMVYVIITAYQYLSEAKQKKFIRGAFSTYLAPAVVQQLIDSPGHLNLGGEERVITAFFSDVQGFTGISESLTPGELVELLNEFLTEMTDIILSYEGTVDKFEGDAIIAFFGAPNPVADHARRACMTCLDMQRRLETLRDQWRAAGKPELHMRIGMCTGPAVVGNMGSKNRMDYTMMGDTVNIAARLEGVNKVYGTYTMVSGSTYQAAGDGILAREIDAVNVVGKKEPVILYELLCRTADADAGTLDRVQGYARGLAAYRKRDWNTAAAHFEAVLTASPEDKPSLALLQRCRAYVQDPPAEDWNGAFTVRSK